MAYTHEERIRQIKIDKIKNRNTVNNIKIEFDSYNDNVNHPIHYTTNTPVVRVKCSCGKSLMVNLECIDVIRNMPSWKGNSIKYLWRAGLKKEIGLEDVDKEIEDLKKAIWYINDRIKQLTNESPKA